MIQIHILNADYRHWNADSVNTDTTFRSLAADMNIEFRLARLDPQGNCTDGIVRYYTHTHAENADDGIKHRRRRMARYQIHCECFSSSVKISKIKASKGVILGYAQFPWSGSKHNRRCTDPCGLYRYHWYQQPCKSRPYRHSRGWSLAWFVPPVPGWLHRRR